MRDGVTLERRLSLAGLKPRINLEIGSEYCVGRGVILEIIHIDGLLERHYNDVIMGAMAPQITSPTIDYSTMYSRRRSKKKTELRVTGLCEGNSPVTGVFPTQKASNAENVSIRWRHRGVKLKMVVMGIHIYWIHTALFSLQKRTLHISWDILYEKLGSPRNH